ncbi:hypothetical protein HPP92_023932 [Vanilla planifolia]|uniref:Uncharacterized protein n=1 Tax=Vanilla planifolia TaxID=51239 RepID=A0A835UAV6_VANPL|nr:hypothetical protein HPP92_023932 [Vanilla planifolia]
MGNSFGCKRKRTIKVMRIDGSTLRLKTPATAGDVLRDHPTYSVLDAADFKTLGLRARRLTADDPLLSGRLYFLVQLPRFQPAVTRRSLSYNTGHSAKDRLDLLFKSRSTGSNLAVHSCAEAEKARAEDTTEGVTRLRVRLPKNEVAKLVEESRDDAEAVQRIVELSVALRSSPMTSSQLTGPKENKIRFLLPEQIIA